MNRIETIDIILALDKSEDEEAWKKKAARKLRVHPKLIHGVRLLKHSIDARQKDIRVQLRVEVGVEKITSLSCSRPQLTFTT